MKRSRGFLAALLGFALAGCATTLNSIPADYTMEGKPESVLIGHVTLDMAVKPIEFFDKLNRISITVENHGTGMAYDIVCDQSGSDSDFFVALPPGEYTISKEHKGNLESSLSGHFTVPQSQVAYFGTLKFKSESMESSIAKSILAGGSGVYGGWAIEDDYEKMLAAFTSRYPHMKQTVVKSLAVLVH